MEKKLCRSCKEEMKKSAGVCPHCGERDQTGIFAVIGFLITMVVVLFLGTVIVTIFL